MSMTIRDARSITNLFRCSFCNKTENEVGTLVAGPGNFICDECIDLCHQLISERRNRIERVGDVEYRSWFA